MALKQPQIKDLARRMAMLNIEPEQMQQTLVQPSLGLGDLSQPTAMAPGIQVAANEPWFSGDNWRVGPFTPDDQSRAAADLRWKEMQREREAAKGSQVPMEAPNTAATQASKAIGAGPSAVPSLGNLMNPVPLQQQAAPQRQVAPPILSAPAPTPAPVAIPSTQAASTPFFDIPGMTPVAPNAPLNTTSAPTGPVNEGEKRALAEGTGTQKELMDRFLQTLKTGDPEKGIQGITNPKGIAAVMSTGTHESAFAPANVYGKWNDPSESGQAGTSGGVLSWRAERYNAMQQFVKARGGDTVENQALFFLQEDPQLVAKLNAAEDPAAAQQMMNQAWRFAGYDRAGGEAGDRIATARRLYSDTGLAQQDPNITTPPSMNTTNALNPEMMGDGRFTMTDVPGSKPMQGPPIVGEMQGPPMVDPTVTGAGAQAPVDPLTEFPAAPVMGEDGGAVNPWTDKAATIGKLGQLVNSMKPPAHKPPTGTAPAPSQGSFNRDPNALKAIMAMLTNMGQSGGQPTLGMLMGGGR